MKLFGTKTPQVAPEVVDSLAQADEARDARQWETAAAAYHRFLHDNPDRADIFVQYGHALKETGDLAGARKAYQSALDLDGNTADTYLQMGHLLKMTRSPKGAAYCYARATELDPGLKSARDELHALEKEGGSSKAVTLLRRRSRNNGLTGFGDRLGTGLHDRPAETAWAPVETDTIASLRERIAQGQRAAQTLVRLESGEGAAKPIHIVFDISDLVSYFDKARLPTGIQRVQIEVISALLHNPDAGHIIDVCSFSSVRDQWVLIPPSLFLAISDMALADGDLGHPDWLDARDDLADLLDLGATLEFSQGAWLINLGTSWWLQNYFLHVRRIKASHGVHYVPFVHDMIPIMAPEHCVTPLTRDFISWALGVFSHADHFLTNSQASLQDLITVGEKLGHHLDINRTQVIPLDADFRKDTTVPPGRNYLDDQGLKPDGYVLFVSTIESRKNHIALLNAWRRLIDKHGVEHVPVLVCVGNRGWLNDQVFKRLDNDPVLGSRVRMLKGVADADLAALYRHCAFSVYPSLYEGWGLPVTEALTYGKPVLVSRISSLPEAAGDFGTYFDVQDADDLDTKLEGLIFDVQGRTQIADRIARDFKPRPWSVLAQQILGTITGWNATVTVTPVVSPPIQPGRYYWLQRSLRTHIDEATVAAEIFRSGHGWEAPEPWGCWTLDGEAVLRGHLISACETPRFYLGLRGVADRDCAYEITFNGKVLNKGDLKAGKDQWLACATGYPLSNESPCTIRILTREVDEPTTTQPEWEDAPLSVGVIGFMICDAQDLSARADFMEAVTTDTLPLLAN